MRLWLTVVGISIYSLSLNASAQDVDQAIRAAILNKFPGWEIKRYQSSHVRIVRLVDDIKYGDISVEMPGSLKQGTYRWANCTSHDQPRQMKVTVKTTLSSEAQVTRSIETTNELTIDIGIPVSDLLKLGIKEFMRQTVRVSSQDTQRVSREDATEITANYQIPAKTVFYLIGSRYERSYSAPFSGRAVIDADVEFEVQKAGIQTKPHQPVPFSKLLPPEAARTFDFAGVIHGIGATDINEQTNERPVDEGNTQDCVPVPIM